MDWHDGPPGYDQEGWVVLVVLDPDSLADHYPPELCEYYGDPVAVTWWGDKGKTTIGLYRVNPEDVRRWATCDGLQTGEA